MRKKFLLIFIFIFLFTLWGKNIVWGQEISSPPVATPTQSLQDESKRIENWEQRMMPQSLQGDQCSWLGHALDFLGIFTCKSYNVQKIVNPEELGAQVEGETQGVMTEKDMEELESLLATPEGEVKGISIPIVGSLSSVVKLLLGEETSGAYNIYIPEALSGYLPQEESQRAVITGTKKTELALLPASFGGNGTRDYFEDAPIPSLIYESQPLSQVSPVTSLRSIFNQVEQWNGVPWQVLEAIARIEGPSLFNKSDEEIIMYSQPGAQFPDNCTPNSCSAAGPMQFTTGGNNLNIDSCSSASGWRSRIIEDSVDGSLSNSCFRNAANNLGISIASMTESQAEQIVRACWPNKWSAHKGAVVQATGESRTPNVCNVKDSIFATGHMLDYTRSVRQQYCNANSTRYQYCCNATDSWDDPNLVKCISVAYYGSCTTTYARLDNKSYCDFVWDYYQQNKNVVVEEQTVQPTQSVEQVNTNQGNSAYNVFYQKYNYTPLPSGCTVDYAGCGPSTAYNILTNFSNRFNMSFNSFLTTLYSNAGCEGTTIVQGRQILNQYNFETEYIYAMREEKDKIPLKDLTSFFENYLAAGWEGIWLNAEFSSSGHHLVVVGVTGSQVWVLDPYYGYGHPIPMDLSTLNPLVKNAFVFRI